ncbi:hypothetical protein B9Z55_021510 [Caenorhabditis nigoni]|uniref:SET domain-containing protein n=1 Tax=Caenorhabditis nigoni TaxID=1611254 RepID=A0A2G5TSF0_9PELO|nr:hypothetical protein B9Z55_021510 [Caenorhabditis nigoni]
MNWNKLRNEKVCAGGVSPLNLNLVFIVNRVINQGEEMIFDYGPAYLTEQMGQCLCEVCKEKGEAVLTMF